MGGSPAATPRHRWMDLLRGLAVLLIALWHVVTVPEMLGGDIPTWVKRGLASLSPYRVPTLLVLSGMLMDRSLAKGWTRYAAGKVRLLLWPFVLWSVIMALLWPDLERLLVHQTWWRGSYHLWFLAVLVFCYLLAPLTRLVPAWVWPVPLILLSQVAPSYGLVRLLWFGAFFFTGAALVRAVPWWQARRPALPLLAGAAATAYGVWVMRDADLYQYRHFPSFLISLVGVAAVVWLAPRVRPLPWVERAGRHSVVVYLVHFPAVALAWRLGERLGLDSWWLMLPGLLVAGLVVPLLMIRWSQTWLFRLPGGARAGDRPAGRAAVVTD